MENIKNQGGGENLESFTLNPAFLLQNIEIDFFDFQFVMNADWTLKECKFKNEVLDPAIWSSLFIIKEKYFKKIESLKKSKNKYEALKEKYQEQEKNFVHKKNCYKKAIYEHQRACDHFRWTVRAFEQLAKCNEKAQQEIEYNKQKWWFSIWQD